MIKGIYPSQVKSYPLIKIGIGPFYLVTHQARLVMNRPNYEKNCCSWFSFIDYLDASIAAKMWLGNVPNTVGWSTFMNNGLKNFEQNILRFYTLSSLKLVLRASCYFVQERLRSKTSIIATKNWDANLSRFFFSF